MDVVHDAINLPNYAWVIIDTEFFKRLQHITQFSTITLNNVNVKHTRWEHCIGVGHLAYKLITRLAEMYSFITEKHIKCVTVAGLMHDIGHGPFSHCWEHLDQRLSNNFNHEEMSCKIVREVLKNNMLLRKCFDDDDIQLICDMIKGVLPQSEHQEKYLPRCSLRNNHKQHYPFLYQIVNNKQFGVDVDKQDYLLRDSYYVYNKFCDYRQIMSFYDRCMINLNTYNLIFDYNDLVYIQRVYDLRHYMISTIFRHPNNMNSDALFIQLLEDADSEGFIYCGLTITELMDQPRNFIKLTNAVYDDLMVWIRLHGSRSLQITATLLDEALEKCIVAVNSAEFQAFVPRKFMPIECSNGLIYSLVY